MTSQYRTTRLRVALATSCIALIIGCGDGGPPMAEAGGTVLINGQPLVGADVIFNPEYGPTAVGQTDDEGKFDLTTNGKSGAVIGKHKVAIQAVEGFRVSGTSSPADEDSSQDEVESEGDLRFGRRWLIPEQYGNPLSSGLTAEVEKGSDNDHTFQLSGKP